MEFGMFHEFALTPGQSQRDAFDLAFEQVDAAEAWGLDVMWLAELHAAPARSVLASPLTLAAAIAGRTKRMKIGTAVQVLPLCHPMRLAEEVATVDQVSHGRLIFGVGRSGFPRVYEAYGVPYSESQERFAETLEIVKRAWLDEPLAYAGKYFNFSGVHVTPKPYQPQGPEIRIAINSPDSFPAAGRQGLPIFGAVRLGTLSELGPNLRVYRDAYKAAGHGGHGRVYLRLPIYIAESRAQAYEEPRESIMHFYRWLGGQLEASASRSGARAIEQRAERGQRLQTIGYDDALRDKVVVGTPEMVIDRLVQLREELGLDGILAEMNCGGFIPHERVMNSLRLLCEQVKPRFPS